MIVRQLTFLHVAEIVHIRVQYDRVQYDVSARAHRTSGTNHRHTTEPETQR